MYITIVYSSVVMERGLPQRRCINIFMSYLLLSVALTHNGLSVARER
jgi:hypothetical protein